MWAEQQIVEQLHVINGKKAPDIIVKNAVYLHSVFKKWMKGNLWIVGDRLVYVGDKMPTILDGTEIVDAQHKKIVPGYIEPHVHPFQLYNPATFAEYAVQHGTTSSIGDNLIFFSMLHNKASFSILEQLQQLPFHYFWWVRYDSQTALVNEKELFNEQSVREWIERDDVLMGGELTGWPRLLQGDRAMLKAIRQSKRAGKKIEGHFPGASERTLNRMKLIGADGDHEAMTVDEVEARLLQGYAVTLRHSSIRPDLPHLLTGIVERKLDVWDHLMMTTDGSTPTFYEDGIMDKCIQVALDAGVSPVDAYQMASYNVARYYNMTDTLGMIATGRFATLNFLEDEFHPTPTDVLVKGQWVKRDGRAVSSFTAIDWSHFGTLDLDFSLEATDFVWESSEGIEMVNDVITKGYVTELDLSLEVLPTQSDENFLMLIDRQGKWRVNSVIKGFATNVQGIATSYSITGDIIVIGKNKKEMLRAFNEVKQMNGGIVLSENGETVAEIPLAIGGGISAEQVPQLMAQEKQLKQCLKERGFSHGDAIYTFLFLQSTHLPYTRITQQGLYEVLRHEVKIPITKR